MANTGKYAGSETEKNLYAAFAGETQARVSTPILRRLQKAGIRADRRAVSADRG